MDDNGWTEERVAKERITKKEEKKRIQIRILEKGGVQSNYQENRRF